MPEMSAAAYWGVGLAGVGVLLLLLVRAKINGTKFLDVPDGVEPPKLYRQWRAKKLLNRISKPAIGIGAAGVAALLSGMILFLIGYL